MNVQKGLAQTGCRLVVGAITPQLVPKPDSRARAPGGQCKHRQKSLGFFGFRSNRPPFSIHKGKRPEQEHPKRIVPLVHAIHRPRPRCLRCARLAGRRPGIQRPVCHTCGAWQATGKGNRDSERKIDAFAIIKLKHNRLKSLCVTSQTGRSALPSKQRQRSVALGAIISQAAAKGCELRNANTSLDLGEKTDHVKLRAVSKR